MFAELVAAYALRLSLVKQLFIKCMYASVDNNIVGSTFAIRKMKKSWTMRIMPRIGRNRLCWKV